jgi:hypothetical protein
MVIQPESDEVAGGFLIKGREKSDIAARDVDRTEIEIEIFKLYRPGTIERPFAAASDGVSELVFRFVADIADERRCVVLPMCFGSYPAIGEAAGSKQQEIVSGEKSNAAAYRSERFQPLRRAEMSEIGTRIRKDCRWCCG